MDKEDKQIGKVLISVMAAMIYGSSSTTTKGAVDRAVDILKDVYKLKDKDLPNFFIE